MKILVHDDGPCKNGKLQTPLVNGFCPACGFHPDMQSRAVVEAPSLNLYVPPRAPVPEPVLTLEYGGEKCTITYTGLHHLLNCGGWDDRHRDNLYFQEDKRLKLWLEAVRQQMGVDASAALRDQDRQLPEQAEPEMVRCEPVEQKALPPAALKSPCSVCGQVTEWQCPNCMADKGLRYPVCGAAAGSACRLRHEAKYKCRLFR